MCCRPEDPDDPDDVPKLNFDLDDRDEPQIVNHLEVGSVVDSEDLPKLNFDLYDRDEPQHKLSAFDDPDDPFSLPQKEEQHVPEFDDEKDAKERALVQPTLQAHLRQVYESVEHPLGGLDLGWWTTQLSITLYAVQEDSNDEQLQLSGSQFGEKIASTRLLSHARKLDINLFGSRQDNFLREVQACEPNTSMGELDYRLEQARLKVDGARAAAHTVGSGKHARKDNEKLEKAYTVLKALYDRAMSFRITMSLREKCASKGDTCMPALVALESQLQLQL